MSTKLIHDVNAYSRMSCSVVAEYIATVAEDIKTCVANMHLKTAGMSLRCRQAGVKPPCPAI